jgi:succinoglycan biosynthesis protein ExoM
MNHLVVGIPTYKRPLMLEKLIHSIYACNIDKEFILIIDILIVDNDLDRTAEASSSKFKSECPSDFKLHYHNYPIKGLSNVRNEIIHRALKFEPDYIVFIDDDEYVTKNWLNELIYSVVSNDGNMAMGPVLPDFEKKVSLAISHWFFRPQHDNGDILDFIITGNLIMCSKFLKEHDLKFDPRFNTSGSEDSYFGISVLKKNGSIYSASKAVVYETIPEKRATLKWLLKRRYSGANTYMFTMILEKCHKKVVKKLIVSFIYFFSGCIFLLFLPFSFKYKYVGLLKIAEGIGGFAGFMNIQSHEYSKVR